MPAPIFHPDIIASCPPDDAAPPMGKVYRKLRAAVPAADDFISDVERAAKGSDKARCECWGCSVWADEAAVKHALELFPHWKKRTIAAGELQEGDGVVKKTPSGKQTEHHTLWKAFGQDISHRFVVFYEPEQN